MAEYPRINDCLHILWFVIVIPGVITCNKFFNFEFMREEQNKGIFSIYSKYYITEKHSYNIQCTIYIY